jgi:hypothetical protein
LQTIDLVASCGLPFTTQPEAPASIKAGASGWAVNDETKQPACVEGERFAGPSDGLRFWSPNASPLRQAEWSQQAKIWSRRIANFLSEQVERIPQTFDANSHVAENTTKSTDFPPTVSYSAHRLQPTLTPQEQ